MYNLGYPCHNSVQVEEESLTRASSKPCWHSPHEGYSSWWPGLDQEIEELVKGYTQCQSVRNAPEVAPLHPWLWPTKRWK